jgi:predicted aspartyl protease
MLAFRAPLARALVALGLLLPGAATADEPPAEAVVGVLPFQDGEEPNRVLVDLAPDGSDPLVMMLDTGANANVLTPLMARRLGVVVRRAKETPYRRATRLGRDLQFWVDTESSDTGSRTGWEYGLLGGEFLGHYVVELDFPGRQVRFLDPKRYRVPDETGAPDEHVVPFKRVGTRILVPIELNGKTVEVLLDTGAPDNAVLSGKAAERVGIDVASLPHLGSAGTVMGPMQVSLYEASSFRFAGFDFEPLPILVAPRGWYNMAPNDSVIGYDVLRQFVVRIDYPRQRLWLKRRGDRRATFMGADYASAKKVGAYLLPQGGSLYVFGVVEGGLAARFGLREGDAIVAPAGEPPPKAADVIARIEARQELTVARAHGDVWVDLILPEAVAAPGGAAAQGGAPEAGDGGAP